MGHLKFNPTKADIIMRNIQSEYNNIMLGANFCQRDGIGKMVTGWISPNGVKGINKAVDDLNAVVEKIYTEMWTAYSRMNNACVAANQAFIRAGGASEGYIYTSKILEKNLAKFDASEAKKSLDGMLIIDDVKLNEANRVFLKFSDNVKLHFNRILDLARELPIEDESHEIINAVIGTVNSLKKNVETAVEDVVTAINTKLSETEADVIQAKNNAKRLAASGK